MNTTLLLIGTHVLCFIGGGLITFVTMCLCMASGEHSRREQEELKNDEN